MSSLQSGETKEISDMWHDKYKMFLNVCTDRNATFELHVEILKYCNVIVALKLAERMGGEDGFKLLLGAVKQSVGWSFMNGATCYGPFCIDLLQNYYSSSTYHKNLIHMLWSTPIKNGNVNHGPDTKRELFHQDATPGIRTARSEQAVKRRLARVDHFTEVHQLQTF